MLYNCWMTGPGFNEIVNVYDLIFRYVQTSQILQKSVFEIYDRISLNPGPVLQHWPSCSICLWAMTNQLESRGRPWDANNEQAKILPILPSMMRAWVRCAAPYNVVFLLVIFGNVYWEIFYFQELNKKYNLAASERTWRQLFLFNSHDRGFSVASPTHSSMLSRSSDAEVSWLSLPLLLCIPSTILKYLSESFSAKRHLGCNSIHLKSWKITWKV